ncbi:hypothetical protein AGMMS49587_03300 [Spirochaetia bacterium]|nr:hypothetical protein AGMMS49587_03300 [Spirochaetia bacterium]
MSEQSSNTAVLDAAGKAHIDSMHRLGRTGTVIAIIVMLGMPIITGIYLDAMPPLLRIITASIGLLAIFAPAALSEVIAYTPIFGSSIYLALITGNVMNLKLPVANTALQLLDVENGTEDADIVTSIAVSVSSFVTILIIIAGVLLILPLQPILTLPSVKLASGYILPALFGSLAVGIFGSNLGGGIQTRGRLKALILPMILLVAIHLVFKILAPPPPLDQLLTVYQGFLILILLPITWFWTKGLFKKGQIKVFFPGEDLK